MKPVTRREALGLVGLCMGGVGGGGGGCASSRPAVTATTAQPALVDLVPAAGLRMLVTLAPRVVLAIPEMAEAVERVVPRLSVFTARNTGIDLGSMEQVVLATFSDVDLWLVQAVFSPARVERVFAERAGRLEGRAVDAQSQVVRFWGTVRGVREQVAILRSEGSARWAMERGRFGVLRAVVAYAQGKLRRSPPALRTVPLEAVASRLGDGAFRVFAPGPFDAEWARGLGGMLAVATGAGLVVRPRVDGIRGVLDVDLVLTGAWTASRARVQVESAYEGLLAEPLGRLLGLSKPVAPWVVRAEDDWVRLGVALDADVVARGIRAATGANVDEILSH